MTPFNRTLAVALLGGSLAACSSSDDDSNPATDPQADPAGGVPVAPADPADPTTAPGAPSGPGTQGDPAAPGDPTDPATPADPADPGTTGGPDAPGDPATPGDPTDPAAPGDPATPSDPTDPVAPGDPTDPVAPSDPATPGDPDTTGDPADATDPVTPTDPADPGAPSDPTDPVAPGDPDTTGDPVDPADPTDPVDPADPTDPADPGTPTDPAAPADPTAPDPENPTAPADPANPVDPATPPIDENPDPAPSEPPAEGEVSQYNRTLTEQLSLGGPSRTDPDRTSDAPSAPSGLAALLVADNWLEFGWVPSTDDGAIVAYEIYRDGQLVGTVTDEANDVDGNYRVEEERNWRTTTYTDCNYTKDINCQTVGQPSPGTSHTYTVVAIDNLGNRSTPSAPATFALETIQGSAAPDVASGADGYRLTFEDEFRDDSLDRDKWRLRMPWGPDTVVNGEMQYFVDKFDPVGAAFPYDPFVLTGDTLQITGVPTPPELLERANGQRYLSGLITTRNKFDIEYGYVEMRARVSSGSGLLSTFYLLEPGGNQYEIDILEYDGRAPDGATQNYHYNDGFRFADTDFQGVPHASPTMILDADIDLSADFHTYSVLWEPELVIWYIDGIEVRRMTGPRVSNAPMNIVAQLVIGSNWIGDPAEAGEVSFPVTYEIDYMRVYQR